VSLLMRSDVINYTFRKELIMGLEKEVHDAMHVVNRDHSNAERLSYNPQTRRLELKGRGNDPDRVTPLCHQDMDLYCAPVIVLDGSRLGDGVPDSSGVQTEFAAKDSETVFSTLAGVSDQRVLGSVITSICHNHDYVSKVGSPEDRVRVLLSPECFGRKTENNDRHWPATGYVKKNGKWVKAMVIISPLVNDLYSRFKGILESDALSDKRVFVAGLGSGGSAVAVGLAKSGVMDVVLVDYDRLEVGNVLRHEAGLSDVGRMKTHVVKDMIMNKNPFAKVQILDEKITWENMERFRPMIKECDIIIAAVDNRNAKRVLNRLSLEENIPMLVAGAFRRAYGGQVLRVLPHKSPCFTCFVDSLPDIARDNEITSIEQAEGLAYTDRPVPIEPGLANDIAPINQMVVKLAIQTLIEGKKTTLKSLDQDLEMPLYLWLNRRENNTCYENLEPMKDNIANMSILRWYGINIPKNPHCPDCGDFEAGVKEHYGIEADLTEQLGV